MPLRPTTTRSRRERSSMRSAWALTHMLETEAPRSTTRTRLRTTPRCCASTVIRSSSAITGLRSARCNCSAGSSATLAQLTFRIPSRWRLWSRRSTRPTYPVLDGFEHGGRRRCEPVCSHGTEGRRKRRPCWMNVLKREPHNAAAVEAMGSLCYARHDEACAKQWYGEAVRLNSASYVALYFYANASMEDRDTGHDAEIESSLRSAMRLAPGYAPAYDCPCALRRAAEQKPAGSACDEP